MQDQSIDLELIKKQCNVWVSHKTKDIKDLHEEELQEIIKSYFSEHPKYQDLEKEITKKVKENFTTRPGRRANIIDDNTNDKWFDENRAKINFNRATIFKDYLITNEIIPPLVVDQISSDSDDILSRLADPNSKKKSVRGLVYGRVQMGKTTSYSMLINKSIDAGYKLIIILTGISNPLRRQTQIAMEEYVIGTSTEQEIGSVDIGVKKHNKENNNFDFKNIIPITRRDSDLSQRLAEALPPLLSQNNEETAYIFIIKKNTSSLRNINAFFDKSPGMSLRTKPALIIDDEADQASLDTKDQRNNEIENPTLTNGQIRILLDKFNVNSYVAYTATPYANIYIGTSGSKIIFNSNIVVKDKLSGKNKIERIDTTSSDEIPSLFPSNFIISLDPPPNYWGHNEIFRMDYKDKSNDPKKSIPQVIILEELEESLQKGKERIYWCPQNLPFRQRKDHIPVLKGNIREIPTSLKLAIKSLIITRIFKDLRLKKDDFNSMLVNTWINTKAHDEIAAQIQKYIQYLQDCIRAHDPKIIEEFNDLYHDYKKTNKLFNNLCELNDKTTFDEINSWEEVEIRLRDSIEKTDVAIMSGDHMVELDNEIYKKKSLIVVGSSKLSRGLVIPKLSISYFLRNGTQYDTLLQMGRWFGYRDEYMDLCRLFISDNLKSNFEIVARADEEMQNEFLMMKKLRLTPEEYGLRIAHSPEFRITSPNKMRNTELAIFTFDGKLAQATSLRYDDDEKDESNELLVRNLIKNQVFEGKLSDAKSDTERVVGKKWSNIPHNYITDFLDSFYSSTKKTGRLWNSVFIQYIRDEASDGEKLKDWTVCIRGQDVTSSSGESKNIFEIENNKFVRSERTTWKIEENYITEPKGQIGNVNDLALDLNSDERELAKEYSIDLRDNKDSEGYSPKGVAAARDEKKGLLLIYPMKLEITQEDGKKRVFERIAVSVHLPMIKNATLRQYRVNEVFQRQRNEDTGEDEWT